MFRSSNECRCFFFGGGDDGRSPGPPRDPNLPRFEQWIHTKLEGLPHEVRQPASTSPDGTTSDGSARRPPPEQPRAARCTPRSMLLLLYAQPLVKVVTLQVDAVDDQPDGMSTTLGLRPNRRA